MISLISQEKQVQRIHVGIIKFIIVLTFLIDELMYIHHCLQPLIVMRYNNNNYKHHEDKSLCLCKQCIRRS